ncbi:apolipoprotein N-acyltransferase [Streptomyces sp. Ru87]|uniref:apolipoprotein N-acyltransferase n=1 Tax=Streptomyces sp. Ru87 TaxID=2044307 RepID=UPI000BF28BA5|nr:apolipoprotein N-acyltransferase [Streptomyces sp. Ru87]PGH51581.1 apolipoprotein N-acyltransferase [Streptomyces sp. Ru87]
MHSGPDTTTAPSGAAASARREAERPETSSGPAVPSAGAPAAEPGAGRRPNRAVRAVRAVRRGAPRTALAVGAGLALALAFPPYGVWPLSLVAVAALSLLTRGRTARQGAWTGFVFGLPFFFLLLRWLSVIGHDAVLGLAAVEALFIAALGAGLAVTSRLPAWPLWAACLWVAEEWARDRQPLGGFPWGRLAFANTGSPFTPLAALGGAPLVTFAVALSAVLLASAGAAVWTLWRTRRTAPAGVTDPSGEPETAGDAAAAGGPAAEGSPAAESDPAARDEPGPGRGRLRAALPAVAAAALALATGLAGYAVPVPTAAADTVRIAVVQGNVQQPGMDFLGRPMKILDNHVEATLQLAEDVAAGREQQPDLVVWPENASDLDPFRYQEAYDRIDRAVRAVGVPVLVGALVDHPEQEGYVENQGIVWDPETGPGASYTKQHPVPFGEYVPYRDQLSKIITRLERVPRDFYPGEKTGVLRTGPADLGDVICFEVAYDEIVRDTVNAGARALVVQTNNATYGRTGQPEQQLVMSKLRAVEHGRAVVTAATSGISAIVQPDGTVSQRTEEFTQDVITANLPLRDDTTPADRVGAIPEWALAIVGLLSCAAAIVVRRRGRTDQRGQQ